MRIIFWSSDVCSSDLAAGRLLAAAEDREDIERVGLYFPVELIRSLGLIADSLRRGDAARLARAMDKLQAHEGMAMRIPSDDDTLIISLLYTVTESSAKASIYGRGRPLAAPNP